MSSKNESADTGGDLLAGLVTVGSLVGTLVQLANRKQLGREREALRSHLQEAARVIRGLEQQVRAGKPSGRIVRRGRVQVRTVADASVARAWAIGQAVRAARLKADLTQKELGARTEMARPNVARIESGRHAPSTDTLLRLAKALGVTLSSLVRVPRLGRDPDDVALAEAGIDEWNDSLDAEGGA